MLSYCHQHGLDMLCRYKLLAPGAVLGPTEALPMVRSLDYHPTRTNEFVAGTDGCDVWEVSDRFMHPQHQVFWFAKGD